jgi:hypothetical protein
MRVKIRSAAAVVAVALAASGCGGDVTAVYDGPLLGSWSAVSVDGEPLPVTLAVTIDEVVCTYTVSAIEFTFLSNSRYTGQDSVSARCLPNPPVDLSQTFAGRFRTSGTTLFMTADGGTEQTSTFVIDGNTLTITSVTGDETNVTVLTRTS